MSDSVQSIDTTFINPAEYIFVSTLNPNASKNCLHFFSVGHQPGADLGPVISPASKERICNLVQSGAEQGAKVL